jgi:hypothetical protein
MAQKTAVDWFWDEVWGKTLGRDSEFFAKKLQEAKQMEKEQKMKFAADFFRWWWNQKGTNTNEAVEQYYKETYGTE